MHNSFCAAFPFILEARKIFELRLVRIAQGGAVAQAEMVSMVSKKVVAGEA